MLPPELDFFNQATVENTMESSDEESASENEPLSGAVAKKTVRKPMMGKNQHGVVKKKVTGLGAKESKKMDLNLKPKLAIKSASKIPPGPGRRSTRSQGDVKKVIGKRGREANSANKVVAKMATRKHSLATLVAKKKTRMATRMLTRGSSGNSFAKGTKKIKAGRSLRGRNVSISSEEEEDVKRLIPRKPRRKKKEESSDEEEADEETSSRESSRRPSVRQMSRRLLGKDPIKKLKKREMRSASRDSSGSKDSTASAAGSRPSRKTKEAATVYLNLLGPKLTSRGEEDDDNASLVSLGEITSEKRLEEVEKEIKQQGKKKIVTTKGSCKEPPTVPVRRVLTPGSKVKAQDDSEEDSSEKEKKKAKKEAEKKKKKQSLKELQDKLLEEAKKDITTKPTSSTSNDSASKIAPLSSTNETDRLSASKISGYIQVKGRNSTDQAEEGTTSSPAPASVTAAGAIVGQVRRLSKNGERTSTPPRKILPKTDLQEISQRKTGSPASGSNPTHLPVGVMGASRLTMKTSSPVQVTISDQQTVPSTLSMQQVPLSQPLVINTGIAQTNSSLKQPVTTTIAVATQPVQITTAPTGGIIMQRMPVHMGAMPMQMRPMGHHQQPQQIITATGQRIHLAGMAPMAMSLQQTNSALQNPNGPQVLRQAFNFQTPLQAVTNPPQSQPAAMQPQSHTLPQQRTNKNLNSMPPNITMASASTTDVTPSNTQPLVSPGPPMLSPQILEQQKNVKPSNSDQRHGQQSNQAQKSQMSSQQQPNSQSNKFQPQMLQLPQVANTKKPSAAGPPSKTQVTTHTKQKTIFTKSPAKQQPSTAQSSSFKVDNEASPYAFEAEPVETKVSAPYRKSTHRGPVPSTSKALQPQAAGSKTKSLPKTPSGKVQSVLPSSSKTSQDAKKATPKQESSPTPSGSSIGSEVKAEADGSFPIPKELQSQLEAQAKKEGKAGAEMTFYIPLQSSSGQSFGVSVKLGTEGPAGPNQKVIMKAKLVTNPTGKPVGARVIGSTNSSSKTTSPERKPNSGSRRFTRMPMASPPSPRGSGSDSDESLMSSSTIGSPDATGSGRKGKAKAKQLHQDDPDSCLGTVEQLNKFPKLGQHAHLVEAPVYKPSEKDFKDPMKYIARIRKEAEPFGFCKIIPPSSFKPECNVDDDMRFTAYNQYIQKMMHRWGQNSREMAAIKKYLETQNVNMKVHPVVGGVEIDLPALYHAVQSFGGLTEVIQRKRWGKIADYLRIPKGTQDRGNKLDDIYCKFLLPWDTLSEVERDELLRLVDEEFEEVDKRKLGKTTNDGGEGSDEEDSEDDEDYECVLKGKSTSLSQFFRVARNLMTMLFKTSEPDPREVEEEYWRLVLERDCHIQVQQGSIDTGNEGFGFPTSRNSSCGRHGWNLKILSNNPKSLLRCMGPLMGVTVPTLHVGMVFTTGCWYRDPHGLPLVEYHHTGASKIWYGVPDSQGIAFYTAMKQLVPTFCRKKKIWLPADTTAVPPNLLVKHGVSVTRTIQEPGQFLVVFPKAYTSYVCTGYSVSESVYYAPKDYLDIMHTEFENIQESNDPMMFPLKKLIICIAENPASSKSTLRKVKPFLEDIRDNEYVKRTMISDLGVKNHERIILKSKKQDQDDEYECEMCSENLYVSYVSLTETESILFILSVYK